MQLSDLITEIGLELNRTDIDARIKRWIQQSIDFMFNTLASRDSETSATLTATTLQETLALPLDFGELIEFRYTPGDSSGFQLVRLSPQEFFRRHADQTTTGYPGEFCIYGNQIYLAVLPQSALPYTITYRKASTNIYIHTLNLTDADGAAASGVQVYLDEDAVETGIGKLYFVSPTETDGVIQLASLDGHLHNVTIYHSAMAATLGVAWYFDEDGATTSERNLFVSPTGLDCVVQTEKSHLHSHYIEFVDAAGAVSTGVGIYLDEDAASKTGRLLFVSPTNADGTSEIILSPDGSIPPFVERYHEAIFLYAVVRGLRWLKQYAEAGAVEKNANGILASVMSSETKRGPVSFTAKPFTPRPGRRVWESLRFPEIDD